MDKDIIELYSWIVRGSQRLEVIKNIGSAKTPSQISKDSKLKLSNVSDVLKSMRERNIVICLNPESKTGRLYQLTDLGKKLLKEL